VTLHNPFRIREGDDFQGFWVFPHPVMHKVINNFNRFFHKQNAKTPIFKSFFRMIWKKSDFFYA